MLIFICRLLPGTSEGSNDLNNYKIIFSKFITQPSKNDGQAGHH